MTDDARKKKERDDEAEAAESPEDPSEPKALASLEQGSAEPSRPIVPSRTSDTLARLAGSLGTGLGDLGHRSRILDDMAKSRSRLADLAAGIDRSTVGRAFGDLEQTRRILGGTDALGRALAAPRASLQLAGGIDELMRRYRQHDDIIKAIGGLGAISRRHSAMANTISAMGGLESIWKAQERMSLALGVSGLGTARGTIADEVLSGASRQIEQVIRDLTGVSAFTGLVKGVAADQARYDSMLSATSAWREMGKQVSLHARLHAELPDLFPQWRRAERGDLLNLQLSGLGERFLGGTGRLASVREEILRLRRPWVDVEHPARSVGAYIEARALQDVIASSPPQSRAVVAAVRAELGDYRETGPIPEVVAADPMLRSAFRIDAGFDTDLSSLPPAILAKIFAPGAGIARNAEADPEALEAFVHRRVKQVEKKLRLFIIAAMTAAIGPQWVKQRVDGKTRLRWKERRQVDVDNSRRPGALLDYAGFEDYRSIIDRNDNWEEVFEPIFKFRVSILETLRRLSLIRNPDAHFRVVTIDDLIDLVSEAGRLDRWLDRGSNAHG